MRDEVKRALSRRALFGGAVAVAGAAAAGAVLVREPAAQAFPAKDKRRARYQADSAEVRNFYRVNSYPAR
jgi:hypothetical protein